jgi:integrase
MRVLERRYKNREEPANPWVFPSRSASGHVRDPKKAWKKICEAAKITNAKPHDLRRSRASYMAIGGASLLQIGQVLGHRSPASTQIYARLMQQTQRESMQLGDKKLKLLMDEAKRREKAGD